MVEDEVLQGLIDDGVVEAGSRSARELGHARRLLTAPRPKLGRLAAVKRDLVERLGTRPAVDAYAQLCAITRGDIRTLPLAALGDYARLHSRTFEELAPARRIALPAPDGVSAPRDASTRATFRCVLDDVVVSSKSNLLVTGDHVLLDHQADELQRVPVDLWIDPIAFAPTGNAAVTVLVEAAAIDADPLETALPLVGVNSYNYWHWLMEFLPRVLLWRDEPGFSDVPIIIDAQMPRQFRDALRFFAGRDGPIVVLAPGEAVRVHRLWTAAMLVNAPHWPAPGVQSADELTILDPSMLEEQFAKLTAALAGLDSNGPRRVYLKRSPVQLRSMVNTDEVEAWFAEQGFVLVEMGDLDFLDQVRLVRGAEIVAGPNGSALTNVLFARPGTSVGVLDNRHLEDNHWYALVATALGHRLRFLAGDVVADVSDYRWNASYRIDVAQLPAFLDTLETDRHR